MGEGRGHPGAGGAGARQGPGRQDLWEIVGYGTNCDAHHITAPDHTGTWPAACIQQALSDAGIAPEQVDYVNAHGTSTPLNDSGETAALKKVFGDHAGKLMVSSTKSMTGHMLGAGGAVEAIFSLLALKDGFVPATINYQVPDPPPVTWTSSPTRAGRRRTSSYASLRFSGLRRPQRLPGVPQVGGLRHGTEHSADHGDSCPTVPLPAGG